MLTLGLFTPLASAVVISVILAAAFSVHVKHGFFITDGGYEYNLVIAVAALSVTFTGPGSLSIDALLGLSLRGIFWGVVALFAGIVAGAVPLRQRRTETSVKSAGMARAS